MSARASYVQHWRLMTWVKPNLSDWCSNPSGCHWRTDSYGDAALVSQMLIWANLYFVFCRIKGFGRESSRCCVQVCAHSKDLWGVAGFCAKTATGRLAHSSRGSPQAEIWCVKFLLCFPLPCLHGVATWWICTLKSTKGFTVSFCCCSFFRSHRLV